MFKIQYTKTQIPLSDPDFVVDTFRYTSIIGDMLIENPKLSIKIGEKYHLILNAEDEIDILYEGVLHVVQDIIQYKKGYTSYNRCLPPLKEGEQHYSIIFPDFYYELPILFFRCKAENVTIYTRTVSEPVDGTVFVKPNRDIEAPFYCNRTQIIKECLAFLHQVMVDLKQAWPNIEITENYTKDWEEIQGYRRDLGMVE